MIYRLRREPGLGAGDRWKLHGRELLGRYLPPPPATDYDVDATEGASALPPARAGYAVALLDAFAPHVHTARVASAAQPQAPLVSAEVGDEELNAAVAAAPGRQAVRARRHRR